MDIKDIQRKQQETKKKVPVNIRIDPEISEWMKFRNVSPTRLFEKAAWKIIKTKDEEWNRKMANRLRKKQIQPKE
jgi:hypothetical protein